MKIIHISDTHAAHNSLEIPECDVLVHSGDWCGHSTKSQCHKFLKWMGKQPSGIKIAVPGNHDMNIESDTEYWVRQASNNYGVNLLVDCAFITPDGVKFYGMPWMPEFYGWGFMLDRMSNAMGMKVDKIPANTDILITHGPPKDVLDVGMGMVRDGCEVLAARVKKYPPKVHMFGHMHSGNGNWDMGGGYVEKDGTLFSNAAIMTEQYQPYQPMHEIDYVSDVGVVYYGKIQTGSKTPS